MQWYCAKKYKPAHALTDVFLRTSGGGIKAGYNDECEDGFIWRSGCENEEVINDVTHFCIPDPIDFTLMENESMLKTDKV